MLERVLNINFNADLNNSKRGYKKDSYLKSAVRTYQEHDALNLSNGLKVLNKYNFKLNKLKQLDSKTVDLSFVYGDIEFKTIVDVDNLSNFVQMKYDIRFDANEPKFTLSLFTKTVFVDYTDLSSSVKSIKYLLERVDSLKVKSELNTINTRALTNLFDNIYNSVLSEFRFLNSVLTKVISDVMGISIHFNSENELGNELILIDKIKPENAG